MSDPQNPEQTEERPLTARDIAALRQELSGAFGSVFKQQQELAARIDEARAGAAPAQPAVVPQPNDIRQRIHDDFVSQPERVLLETAATGARQAMELFQKQLAERDEKMALENAYASFCQGFYGHPNNAGLLPFKDQIEAHLRRGGVDIATLVKRGDADTLAKAFDWAAEQVRTPLVQAQQAALENEKRQRAGARFAAGAPGAASYGAPPSGDDAQPMSRQEKMADYLADRQKHFSTKQWNKADYHDRLSQLRLVPKPGRKVA